MALSEQQGVLVAAFLRAAINDAHWHLTVQQREEGLHILAKRLRALGAPDASQDASSS
jgi:hypothetical protein